MPGERCRPALLPQPPPPWAWPLRRCSHCHHRRPNGRRRRCCCCCCCLIPVVTPRSAPVTVATAAAVTAAVAVAAGVAPAVAVTAAVAAPRPRPGPHWPTPAGAAVAAVAAGVAVLTHVQTVGSKGAGETRVQYRPPGLGGNTEQTVKRPLFTNITTEGYWRASLPPTCLCSTSTFHRVEVSTGFGDRAR